MIIYISISMKLTFNPLKAPGAMSTRSGRRPVSVRF